MSDPFTNDVLERLIRSNRDYQRAHGDYIVPLAERLLDSRASVADRDRTIAMLRDDAERDAERCQTLSHLLYAAERRAEAAERRLAALTEALLVMVDGLDIALEFLDTDAMPGHLLIKAHDALDRGRTALAEQAANPTEQT